MRHAALLLSAVRLCGALVVSDPQVAGQYVDCHCDWRYTDCKRPPSFWLCNHLSGFLLSHHGAEKTVLCIGDSITAGTGVNKETQAYPAVLHRLLNQGGSGYNVVNLGIAGAILQNMKWSSTLISHFSFWNLAHWKVAMGAAFDVAVIQLGTNDCEDAVWNDKRYREGYTEMIRQLRKAQPQAKIIAAIPPPSGKNKFGINPSKTRSVLPMAIRRVIQDLGVEGVDLAQKFADHEAEGLMSADNVHPTAAGHAVMARGFATAVGRL